MQSIFSCSCLNGDARLTIKSCRGCLPRACTSALLNLHTLLPRRPSPCADQFEFFPQSRRFLPWEFYLTSKCEGVLNTADSPLPLHWD